MNKLPTFLRLLRTALQIPTFSLLLRWRLRARTMRWSVIGFSMAPPPHLYASGRQTTRAAMTKQNPFYVSQAK